MSVEEFIKVTEKWKELTGFQKIGIFTFFIAGLVAFLANFKTIFPPRNNIIPIKAFNIAVILENIDSPFIQVDNESKIKLQIIGKDFVETEKIDDNNEVYFKNIPPEFTNDKVKFIIESKFHKLSNPDSVYQLPFEGINLKIKPKLIDSIKGIILDMQNQGIPNAEVKIIASDTTLKVNSNSVGEFIAVIPNSNQSPEIKVVVRKTGFRYTKDLSSIEEIVDASEALENLIFRLEKINLDENKVEEEPQEPKNVTVSTSNMVLLNLKYKNQNHHIKFPENYTVNNLKTHVLQTYAREYLNQMHQIDIIHYGQILDRNRLIKNLNFPPNGNDISLTSPTNQDGVIPLQRFQNFEIKGIGNGDYLVFINDQIVSYSKYENGKLLVRTGPLSNNNKNTIIIENLSSNRKTKIINLQRQDINQVVIINITGDNYSIQTRTQ
ncbi:MAG: carboxypeptidase regulatory-like domain-containing protein [Saprospiraceae bacterium]|nr:carboxypeptidase regulatory-like domain-containing protein [Saprospiraceae bacterium]